MTRARVVQENGTNDVVCPSSRRNRRKLEKGIGENGMIVDPIRTKKILLESSKFYKFSICTFFITAPSPPFDLV